MSVADRFDPDVDRAVDLVPPNREPVAVSVIAEALGDGEGLTGEGLSAALVLALGQGIAGDVTGFGPSDSEAARAARRRVLWQVLAGLRVARYVTETMGIEPPPQANVDPRADAEYVCGLVDSVVGLARQAGAEQEARISTERELVEVRAELDRVRAELAARPAQGISPRWAREVLEHLQNRLGQRAADDARAVVDRTLTIVREMESGS